MKKIYFLLIFFTIIANMYLIFGWTPSINDIAVNSYENINDIKSIDKEEIPEEVSFYFNPDEGIEALDESDVEEMNTTLKRLSTSDLSKWSELKNDKNNDKVMEFFKLIKKRMTSDDYEKIKSVIGKIIYVDRVEVQLENNYV